MKIDSSRYNLFWSNPERYRLREIWKLAPIEPAPDSFAALYTYGRRRGTCTHELRDAKYRQVSRFEALESLKAGGYGDKEIQAAIRLADAVEKKYPNEQYLAHEALFEYPIPNSPHVMTGRMDHILRWEPLDGRLLIGDFKTSKKRTKKDMEYRKSMYAGSSQVSFYFLGASTLGFNTNTFLYRILEDKGPKKETEIHEVFTERTGLQLKAFARGVHITCELIEWMKETFGVENPWPQLWEPFENCPVFGYGSILGRKMYENYMPEGFTDKIEHLETMMDDDEGEEPDAS